MHTIHTGRSRLREEGNASHRDTTKNMQRKFDHLKEKLRLEQRRRSPSISDLSSDDEENGNYRRRSRTPPSESFSHEEERYHERIGRNSSSKGL